MDLSGNDNNGLVTGNLCFASDVKVNCHVVLLVIWITCFVTRLNHFTCITVGDETRYILLLSSKATAKL